METSYTTIQGSESENDWYCCVRRSNCGYIGVTPNGVTEFCPDCGSGLEPFEDTLYKCTVCSTEYIGRGDADGCCSS